MTALVPFGLRLARLLEVRRMPGTITVDAEPDDALLRRLGPELGLHTADLYLIAGRPVPDDLAPAQLDGPWNVGSILRRAVRLNAPERGRLRRFVDGLPASPVRRTRPFPDDEHDTTAGVILRRLVQNRNLRLDAPLLYRIGHGPYVSTSTYWMATAERIPLADRFVNPIARLVGIPVPELAALLGLDTVETGHPLQPDMAGLAWAARRLDDDQILAAIEFAG